VPPLFEGKLGALAAVTSGQWTLGGILLCLLGIVASGAAGLGKERDLSDEKKRETVKEFSFGKGIVIAFFCGLLSACMSFAFRAGAPVVETAVRLGTPTLWAALPLLVIILLGGLASNLIWSLALNARRGTFGEYVGRSQLAPVVPIGSNVLFCAAAGITWYFQFFFYSMGESRMGVTLKFSSWTLHMAAIIIFSTVWGLWLHEWRGVSARTRSWVATGLAALIVSTLIVGYGNYLAAPPTAP
jgi:L-rhamnose-H+ transport protein